MTAREMEDLLHRYPEMLLEPGLRALRGEEELGPVRLLFRDEKKGRVVACDCEAAIGNPSHQEKS